MCKRILHVVSGDLWGGAEAQMAMQLPEVQRLGYEVHVLLFNDQSTAAAYRSAGLQVHICEEQKGATTLFRTALQTTREIAPQVVVSHGYKEAILCTYLSYHLACPWLAWFHGISEGYGGFSGCKNYVLNYGQRILARCFAKRIVVVSQDAARRLGFARAKKLRIVFNAYAPAQAQSLQVAKGLQRPAVISVGRLVPIKRFDRAIKAFLEVCRTQQSSAPHLYLIGEGPNEESLKALVKESEFADRVHFLGFQKNASEWIAAADVLVISSDSEGLPTVLLEALAWQRPIVSTNVGGIAEVLDEFPEYPYALVELDPSAMATALAAMTQASVVQAHAPERALREDWTAVYRKHFLPEVAAAKQIAECEAVLKG